MQERLCIGFNIWLTFLLKLLYEQLLSLRESNLLVIIGLTFRILTDFSSSSWSHANYNNTRTDLQIFLWPTQTWEQVLTMQLPSSVLITIGKQIYTVLFRHLLDWMRLDQIFPNCCSRFSTNKQTNNQILILL